MAPKIGMVEPTVEGRALTAQERWDQAMPVEVPFPTLFWCASNYEEYDALPPAEKVKVNGRLNREIVIVRGRRMKTDDIRKWV
ncbi:hypothetical protein KIPB_000866 [Kipferlia bialata]|uniref:Uncharacterized protein n=1 Tax=Kipferlia bialata TaxID=797122 RepID=A0A9K3CR76_9EUKA|nr:hypothetical protein KIPB_000866 [Kipferlia bialata]|eukprot:g866.t1